ncbi:MAG: hypothetical protein ABJC13_21755 [Acidobacteriota bacterium]
MPVGSQAAPITSNASASDLAEFDFTPPENGMLNEPQVQMFVEVQKKAAALRDAGKRKGEPVGAVDLAAARELGDNPKELTWVADRVREVQRWQMNRDLEEQLAAGDRDYLRLLKSQRAQETDPARKAELDQRIADLGSRKVEGELTLALHHNADLVEKYKDQIDAATSAEEKFTTGRLAADQAIPEALFSDFSSDLIDETPPQ